MSGEKWTLKNFHHKYVELFVRAFEKVPYLNDTYVRVPRSVAELFNYPDSTWQRAGKNLAYHTAHAAAILSVGALIVVPILVLVM